MAKSSYRRLVITLKQVLKQAGREMDAGKIPMPKRPEPRVALLSREEIQKLLAGCTNVRDRLLIQFLVELGSRRGKVAALHVKDIQFDQYSPIVWLRGKTGERRRRVYVSKPDLLRYLEDHPYKENANAPFWVTRRDAQPLQYEGIYKIVSKLGWRTLHRQIYPHMFRHTRCTEDSKRYTDSEMMLLFGWKTAEQVRVYSHISMRGVDQHDLILHGIKPAADAETPLIETRRCPKCQAENAPVAIYCQSCGDPITQQNHESQEKLRNLETEVQQLREGIRIIQDTIQGRWKWIPPEQIPRETPQDHNPR